MGPERELQDRLSASRDILERVESIRPRLTMRKVRIGNKLVGPGEPVFVVAEVGKNHNGDIEIAKALVKLAAKAGADAVKFQSFRADRLLSQARTASGDLPETAEPEIDFLKRLELNGEQHFLLARVAGEEGIYFLSTPEDPENADMLQDVGVPAFKVSSLNLTNLPFLQYIARKGVPMIVSTGMGNLGEVERAIACITAVGNDDIILLHCTSLYPTRPEDVNLRAMQTLSQAFLLPVGYSDHTLGNEVSIAAVALGAVLIEKHITLDKSLPGPDHRLSASPEEFQALVTSIRTIERSLGSPIKGSVQAELATRELKRRSIVAGTDIRAGTKITLDMLDAKCPGLGLSPYFLDVVVGRTAQVDIAKDEFITWDKV